MLLRDAPSWSWRLAEACLRQRLSTGLSPVLLAGGRVTLHAPRCLSLGQQPPWVGPRCLVLHSRAGLSLLCHQSAGTVQMQGAPPSPSGRMSISRHVTIRALA